MLQSARERLRRQNLTNRNGVNPNRARSGTSGGFRRACAGDNFRRHASQALAKGARRFAPAPPAKSEVRREKEHARRSEYAIEEEHSKREGGEKAGPAPARKAGL